MNNRLYRDYGNTVNSIFIEIEYPWVCLLIA